MNTSRQPTNRSLGLTGFDHSTLIVSDVQASRAFYVDQLGMAEVQRPDFNFPGAWFEIGSTMIHVTQASDLAGLAGWGDRKVKHLARGHHLAFRTSDFDAALEAIQQLAIPIAEGPKIRPDGARQIYIFDPDQHVIEICTPPGSSNS